MGSAVRVLALVGPAVLLAGCSSAERPAVEAVATTFEDPSADPEVRCDLLAPMTLAALEEQAGAPCEEAVEELPLRGGDVTAVEIWGGDAQVRLDGDTLFLTETRVGWRVVAAVCTPRPERPYDCEVEGP
ncbi:hypothetical protein [Blastococcus sp. PRF04-17]|uniref:hypothetical protein n=1 Tax=Blastococcus sp. PRF04-17 TaxID=2933797 RepID=UPI001FF193B2|nr:hypothetical protein [Blastococcus sp. PRF04-17]UOY03802.1 hypothetical protein MVA48_10925 [Blastococcus sp. PRF04-17]